MRNTIKRANNQQGAVIIILAILVMGAMVSAAAGTYILTRHQLTVVPNFNRAYQAYYTAEAGLEDALLRIVKNMNLPSSYQLDLGGASTTIQTTDFSNGSKNIRAVGERTDRYKSVALTYSISTTTIPDLEINLGLSAGIGGLLMENSCSVIGDVTSSGDVEMQNTAQITGAVRVALVTNKIKGGTVSGNVYSETCENTNISGKLTVVNNIGCSASSYGVLSGQITTTSPYIPDDRINDWKTEAEAGGTISTTWEESSGTHYLGPIKIDNDLIVRNSAKLFITGTIWVTGNVEFKNSAEVRLDASYGTTSGALVADGIMTFRNTATAFGSGDTGSYLILLSTNNSTPAIDVDNSFASDILYAPYGQVKITNSTGMKHVTGHSIHLRNGASLIYDPNMMMIIFPGGGGGGSTTTSWRVGGWKEVE